MTTGLVARSNFLLYLEAIDLFFAFSTFPLVSEWKSTLAEKFMIFNAFDDCADLEFDPASPISFRLFSASSPFDSANTDVLPFSPFLNYDDDDVDENGVPTISSGTSSSDVSPSTSLETPLEITSDRTPESADESPSNVTEFDESFPYLSPPDSRWPDTPSGLLSGPPKSTLVTITKKRHPTSKAVARRRKTSGASDSQSVAEFAGLTRLVSPPPLVKNIRCVLLSVWLTVQETERPHASQPREQFSW